FVEGLAKVKLSIHLSTHVDETGEKSNWHVPRAHEYEAWGDQKSFDGTISVQQPLISPLYNGRSDAELLAFIANLPDKSGYGLVRTTMRDNILSADSVTSCGEPKADGTIECRSIGGGVVTKRVSDIDKAFQRALRDGKINAAAGQRMPLGMETTRTNTNVG